MTRAKRRLAFPGALMCCALLAAFAKAGPAMSTANNEISRDVDNGGGSISSTASNKLTGSIAEEVALTTASTANNRLRSGFSTIAYYPGTLTSITVGADITASSVTLTWPTPGYDGNQGPLVLGPAGSFYLIQVASASTLGNFGNLNTVTLAVSTSPQTLGKIVGSGVAGLDPNTTYFAQVFLEDNDANVSGPFTTDRATFTTLATAPTVGALEFLSVQPGSATVAWLGPTQPAVSSMTNEGYTLKASSSNFDDPALGLPIGAPIFSSATFSALASTLTLSVSVNGVPLNLANTYYFQVASLNWAGQPNVTTFTKLNFQIQPSAILLHLGAMDPTVARSTVSTSSMVVTNVGNWPVTLELSASTATAGGSPWTLSTAPGIETAVLKGVFNSGLPGPPASLFTTFITGSTTAATAANYTGNQNAVQIPSGQSRTLWFNFTLPNSSVSLGPETIGVTTSAIYP